MSEATLTAAFTAVREDLKAQRLAKFGAYLDAKVKSGELTQQQAEAIKQAAAKGIIPARGGK